MFGYRLLWQSWKHSLLCVSLYTCECVHTLCNICLTSFLHCYSLEKTFCYNSTTWTDLLSRIAYFFSFFFTTIFRILQIWFCLWFVWWRLNRVNSQNAFISMRDMLQQALLMMTVLMIWHTFWAVIGWSVCNAVCCGVTHMYSKNIPDDSQKMCRKLDSYLQGI